MHRCKDTVGNKPSYGWLTFSLPEDVQKKFSDDCKYLGVTEGDEIIYRAIVEPHVRNPLHPEERRVLIDSEKICFQMEKDCRELLQHPNLDDELRRSLGKTLAKFESFHPLWIECGARRAKTPEDHALIQSGFKTVSTRNV
jgi:hypothetical protein